jgi:hypothetical protein
MMAVHAGAHHSRFGRAVTQSPTLKSITLAAAAQSSADQCNAVAATELFLLLAQEKWLNQHSQKGSYPQQHHAQQTDMACTAAMVIRQQTSLVIHANVMGWHPSCQDGCQPIQ